MELTTILIEDQKMNIAQLIYKPRSGIEQVIKDKTGKLVMYLYTNDVGNYCLKIFQGKRAKPIVNYSYHSKAARDDAATRYFAERSDSLKNWEELKSNERKDRTEGVKKAIETIKVGDLFCYSVSYNMTINSFYQIVQKTGKKLVVIQANSKRSGDGWSGEEWAVKVPDSDIPNHKHYTATITGAKRIKVEDRRESAYLTTESERHSYNHLD